MLRKDAELASNEVMLSNLDLSEFKLTLKSKKRLLQIAVIPALILLIRFIES